MLETGEPKSKVTVPGNSPISKDLFQSLISKSNLSDVVVKSSTLESTNDGAFGREQLFSLNYQDAHARLPHQVLARYSTLEFPPSGSHQEVMVANEVEFYQHVQNKRLSIVPQCIAAQIDPDKHQYLLILDGEITQHEPGLSLADARKLMLQLLPIHASSWALGVDGVGGDHVSFRSQERYQRYLSSFLHRFGSQLDSDQQAIFSFLGNSDSMWSGSTYSLESFVCGRCCLGNIARLDETLKLADWRYCHRGNPLDDVAMLLASTQPPELLRHFERALIEEYTDSLVARGLKDFGFEDCWQAYLRGALKGLEMVVYFSVYEDDDELLVYLADRFSRHALEVDVRSLG